MNNRITEIRTRCRGGKQFEVDIQFILKIITDILYHFLFGSGRKARDWYGILTLFAFLIIAYKLAYIQIVYSKVLAPGREAMSLIYNKTFYMTCRQYSLNGLRTKHLWRDIQ